MRKLLFNYSFYSHPEIEISGCDTNVVGTAVDPYRRPPRRQMYNYAIFLRIIYFGKIKVEKM
jgi:hypothetical protein